jgi:hypothetical protein
MRNCVDGPSSGSLTVAFEARDAVEAREFDDSPHDFTEAVEGRVELAAVLPGILS